MTEKDFGVFSIDDETGMATLGNGSQLELTPEEVEVLLYLPFGRGAASVKHIAEHVHLGYQLVSLVLRNLAHNKLPGLVISPHRGRYMINASYTAESTPAEGITGE